MSQKIAFEAGKTGKIRSRSLSKTLDTPLDESGIYDHGHAQTYYLTIRENIVFSA